MLTTDQINAVATLGAAIARINAREEKTLANTKQRYAIERGAAKANADSEALRLHGIDLETDEDVRAWRESEASELAEELASAPADQAGQKRRGA